MIEIVERKKIETYCVGKDYEYCQEKKNDGNCMGKMIDGNHFNYLIRKKIEKRFEIVLEKVFKL